MTIRLAIASCVLAAAIGCSERAVLIPNFDPSIDKKLSTLRSESAACFPYNAAADRGAELPMRAELGYTFNQITLVQFSGQTWDNVQLWINGTYVIHLDRLESRDLKRLSFKLFMDESGMHFPLNNEAVRVEKLEIKKDGVFHPVHAQIG